MRRTSSSPLSIATLKRHPPYDDARWDVLFRQIQELELEPPLATWMAGLNAQLDPDPYVERLLAFAFALPLKPWSESSLETHEKYSPCDGRMPPRMLALQVKCGMRRGSHVADARGPRGPQYAAGRLSCIERETIPARPKSARTLHRPSALMWHYCFNPQRWRCWRVIGGRTRRMQGWLDLKRTAEYCSLSVCTLRRYIGDPHHPLPVYCVGGK